MPDTSAGKVLEPFRFDPKCGAWVPDRTPTEDSGIVPPVLTILTWNVWFDPYFFDMRFRALLEIVHARQPDVICFQEITPKSLSLLLDEPWIRACYRISDAFGDTVDSYGVVLLSRLPIRSLVLRDMPSYMGRRMLACKLLAGEHSLVVATVHLESTESNRKLRLQQLAMIFPWLKESSANSVLVGDFNFCATWPENAAIDSEFKDLWPALRGRDPGYTEDTRVNTMLYNAKHQQKQVRYDRALLRSSGGAWRARLIERLGMVPIAKDLLNVFPSDHFGLSIALEAVRH